MTDALFLGELGSPQIGGVVAVTGDEGRHAVQVRRIRVGERVFVADGHGSAVHGEVVAAEKGSGLRVRVDEVLTQPEPQPRIIAVQALAKGDRDELAVESMTEAGVAEFIPWQASRSIVKWTPERMDKQLGRWRSTAREATKQSRRFRVPQVSEPLSTKQLCARFAECQAVYVLHEEATAPLAEHKLPDGDIMIIVGPEGGIAPDELEQFRAAEAQLVRVSDAVLRTSTAGLVAVAQLQALARRRAV